MKVSHGHPQSMNPLQSQGAAGRWWSRYLLLGLVLTILWAPVSVWGQPMSEDTASLDGSSEASPWKELGLGMGSVAASLVYSPVKIVYAGIGLITSGLGFVLSAGNVHVATSILDPAIGGDYVVTPSHLRGEKHLAFMGTRRFAE